MLGRSSACSDSVIPLQVGYTDFAVMLKASEMTFVEDVNPQQAPNLTDPNAATVQAKLCCCNQCVICADKVPSLPCSSFFCIWVVATLAQGAEKYQQLGKDAYLKLLSSAMDGTAIATRGCLIVLDLVPGALLHAPEESHVIEDVNEGLSVKPKVGLEGHGHNLFCSHRWRCALSSVWLADRACPRSWRRL